MKKIIFILLSISCASVMAYPRGNLFLEISVQNNTASTCYLTHMKLIHGTIHQKDFDYKIVSGETVTLPRMAEEFSYGPKVILSYECEGGRAIVLESEKTRWRIDNLILGHIVSAVSMDATFTSSPANWYNSEPGKINWVLL